jgi:hypothetical protein
MRLLSLFLESLNSTAHSIGEGFGLASAKFLREFEVNIEESIGIVCLTVRLLVVEGNKFEVVELVPNKRSGLSHKSDSLLRILSEIYRNLNKWSIVILCGGPVNSWANQSKNMRILEGESANFWCAFWCNSQTLS